MLLFINVTRGDINGRVGGTILHCKMATLQEEMCRGRHHCNARKESQGFRVVKIPEAEGAVRIATGNGIVEMVGCDEDMSLGLGSWGRNDGGDKDLQGCLMEQDGLDLASNVVGRFVAV